jgi:hypothetical protein
MPKNFAIFGTSSDTKSDQATKPLACNIFESVTGGNILGLHGNYPFMPSPGASPNAAWVHLL